MAKGPFNELVEHLHSLKQELVGSGFTEAERAAILGAEARSFHLDMKVIPELEAFLIRNQGFR